MDQSVDARFFDALKTVCAEIQELNPEVRSAVDAAASSGNPEDFHRARLALNALDAAKRDSILQRVHRLMVTDISAIWGSLPLAPKTQRPN